MVPNGTTRVERGNEMGFYRDLGRGPERNDIRVKTEIDVESLQKPETVPA